ncbi:MAG: tRNA (adenosine(37)-N6)-threonylcarbamoyltransferase complex dimerization subunit type 1 TsaB [candidate division WOR-3 bacterium]|nr:tRNA (adenosine(37)-N6)-threonylcarbamoyltransferase complex dimerization subunit type 1 TsaB [candidate division WOR-3 bacterium]
MTDSYFLGITTVENETGLALVKEDKVIYEIVAETSAHHNETIFPFLKNGLDFLGITTKEIKGIGVVIGPGMFTSLRVGLACAKGLAIVDNIPIKGINTLDALVVSLPNFLLEEKRTIIPVLDIRRNEVYFRIYHGIEPVSEPEVITPEKFCRKIPANAILLGSGLIRYHDEIKKLAPNNFLTYNRLYPAPSQVAFFARKCILNSDFSDTDKLVPIYIR